MPAITLRDVARRSGVSVSTVCGVLNNRADSWASAETRHRIWEAAAELGYRPNQAARALRTGRTSVVTLLFHQNYMGPRSTFDGAAEIMAVRLSRYGYELKLRVYPNQGDMMSGLTDIVKRQACDAIVIFGRESDVVEQGAFLEGHNIPFVVKGRLERAFPHWYQVDYDHEGMMRAVVSHFVGLGHHRIAYVGLTPREVYQERLISGFQNAYDDLVGGSLDQGRLLLCDDGQSHVLQEGISTWFSLPESEQPTAIAIGTSFEEWHCIERALAAQGRIIGDGPGQVAVAGQASSDFRLAYGRGHVFSDTGFASIGQTAVDDLLSPLLREKIPAQPVQRILPDLIPTQSLGLAPP